MLFSPRVHIPFDSCKSSDHSAPAAAYLQKLGRCFLSPALTSCTTHRRVTMFHAGDELYSGAWLSDFQKTGLTAWHVCTEKLRVGPLTSCDGELLQAFCAQTLARLARAFASHFDVNSQRSARDTLEALLAVHAYGQTLVWKQLALALACAE